MASHSSTIVTKLLAPKAEKVRFVIVGFLNTAIDFTTLNILIIVLGQSIYAANLLSTFVAMCVSLLLNKAFVFQRGSKVTGREFFSFIGVTLTGIWGVQTLVIYLLTQQFPEPINTIAHTVHSYGLAQTVSIEFLADNSAKLIATIASLIWNYTLYKRIVFMVKGPKKKQNV